MKSGEVPQDEAALLDGFREVQYAVNEQGKYVQVISKGWEPKAAALAHALELHSDLAQATRLRVEAGELSPLAFHMDRAMMDVSILAAYADVPKRVVKRLLKPEAFAASEVRTRERLAKALNLSVSALGTLP
ncbi:MAG: hypothetical protein ACT4TC_11240 [Myxococcaceae bacterium]